MKNGFGFLLTIVCLFQSIDLSAQNRSFQPLRIAMVTVSTPNRVPFAQFTVESFNDYAKKWGYDLHLFFTSLDESRPVQWSKIKAVTDLLKRNEYDWVVWLDDDLIITNPEISFEKTIQEHGQKADLIISSHHEKSSASSDVNTGLFLVKNTRWSLDFLQRVWDIGNDRYNKVTGSLWEQDAMQELLATDDYKKSSCIKCVPARTIESFMILLEKGDKGDYGLWQPGDFAAHLAGQAEWFRISMATQLWNDPNKYPDVGMGVKEPVGEFYTIKSQS